jgi:hypothetical protein
VLCGNRIFRLCRFLQIEGLFFVDGTGVWTQDLAFAKQALYCLRHTSSLLCSGYLGVGGFMNYLPRLISNCDPPHFSLSSSKDYRHEHQCPARQNILQLTLTSYFRQDNTHHLLYDTMLGRHVSLPWHTHAFHCICSQALSAPSWTWETLGT